ncbi:FG-GAP repeat domain-containing protein [Fulvivirga ligni]|uniref:FG-GAP repeat domain-containing protein n=1 Tax=Fulvivirga ligni TaxID=2904246 RepID=UPI001F3E1D12|nr:VCBS repeat-containing protein [Fulvivirga ligni]UII22845.1 VCBS repeat-containing protein [Fulvivirga ligni]
MKIIFSIILFLTIYHSIKAQNTTYETIPLPEAEYAVYLYDSNLLTDRLTYQYANKWDIDNDGTMDSISFIGNGGAHVYFHLEVKTSSDNIWTRFPTFYIDMPYLFKEMTDITQFLVMDFDNDGVDEIYLDIDNPFGSIPEILQKEGITSNQLLIEFEDGKIRVKNF